MKRKASILPDPLRSDFHLNVILFSDPVLNYQESTSVVALGTALAAKPHCFFSARGMRRTLHTRPIFNRSASWIAPVR